MAVLVISLPIAFAEELNLVYDANGNLISGDGFVREYDGFNQLIQVKNDSGNILEEFIWHPIEEKILIKKVYNSSGDVAQRIVYANGNTVKIKNSSGTFYEHYVYQDNILVAQMDANGNKQFLHPDHLGSTNLITDATGAVIEDNFYSPFGEQIEFRGSRFGYEGKEFDSITQDTDFHFRKYKPEWGRFTQPDTLIPNVYDPQSLNRYSFERSNPYKYEDPDGHIFWVPFVIGAAAGLIHGGYHYYKTGDVKGAVIHGSITAAVTTASILAPITTAGGTLLRGASYVGTRLFVTGATGSLAHSAVDGQDFTSSQPYVNALLSGTLNAIGTPLLHRLGVPGLTNYKPGQYFPSNSFSPAMFNEFVSTAISTGAIDVSSAAILSQANRYFSYFSQQANAASGNSGSSGPGGGGGGGGCRCGPWGDLREEAEKAKPGETAGDIIRRWREKQ